MNFRTLLMVGSAAFLVASPLWAQSAGAGDSASAPDPAAQDPAAAAADEAAKRPQNRGADPDAKLPKLSGKADILTPFAFDSSPTDAPDEVDGASTSADVWQLPNPMTLMHQSRGLAAPTDLRAELPKSGNGLMAKLSWAPSTGEGNDLFSGYVILQKLDDGRYTYIDKTGDFKEERWSVDAWKLTEEDPRMQRPPKQVTFRVASLSGGAQIALERYRSARAKLKSAKQGDDPGSDVQIWEARLGEAARTMQAALAASTSEEVTLRMRGSLFNWAQLPLLLLILLFGGLVALATQLMSSGRSFEIRRIAGVDAIEEAIGRATEMGQPVLYVPGIDELQDMQTIASMLILGRVAEIVARYDSDIIVSCCIPVVREVADEVVRTGFTEAGRADAYRPENVRFISSEQFAFCAGTNGIMYREKPAANILLGRFFAESLILAETGYVNGSIQVAGTAEATQLPFFVAACDYTLIGEELYAVSAYLSEDPRLVSSLKASDWVKLGLIGSLVVGTVLNSLGVPWLVNLFSITQGGG